MINGLLRWHTTHLITKKWYGKISRKSIVESLSLLGKMTDPGGKLVILKINIKKL